MKKIKLWGTIGFTLVLLLSGRISVAQYTPEQMLKVEPSQVGVVVDNPAAEEVPLCKVIEFKETDYVGVCLAKPDGVTPLRVWCAKVGSDKVEQIRFYRQGNEVFRDVLGLECRWLNEGGSRRGTLNSKNAIVKWVTISPEEATAEIVTALATGDLARYKLVALSETDMAELGIDGSLAIELKKQVAQVDRGFIELCQRLKIPATAKWGAFNGSHPALLPQGKSGLLADLPAYFNAGVVLMNKENSNESHQLYIGDLVRIGNAWKIIGLPTGEEYGKPSDAISIASVLFPTQMGLPEGSMGQGADYDALAEQINEAQRQLEQATYQDYPILCEKTYKLLIQLAVKNPKEEISLVTQAADLLFSAIQTGLYPQGIEHLGVLYDAYRTGSNMELAAHIRLRQIDGAFYAVAQSTPRPRPAELEKAQTKHTDELAAFANEYPQTSSGAVALMYLAMNQEYLQENEQAIVYYSTVYKHFSKTALGKKAGGAVNRLQSEGKPFAIPRWKFIEGGELDLASYQGKQVAIFCWASWAADEVEKLKTIRLRYPNLQVIGICMDSTVAEVEAYFKQLTAQLPWKNVYEIGGLEGSCALELGVSNVPLIILLDAEGRTIRSNIMSVDDLEIFLKTP